MGKIESLCSKLYVLAMSSYAFDYHLKRRTQATWSKTIYCLTNIATLYFTYIFTQTLGVHGVTFAALPGTFEILLGPLMDVWDPQGVFWVLGKTFGFRGPGGFLKGTF